MERAEKIEKADFAGTPATLYLVSIGIVEHTFTLRRDAETFIKKRLPFTARNEVVTLRRLSPRERRVRDLKVMFKS